MLDMTIIENTIEELENAEISFDNCFKLATLYYLRDRPKNVTEQEFQDVLPMYRKYIDVKREFQKNNISKLYVSNALKDVCKELDDLFQLMYKGTDTSTEREILQDFIEELYFKFVKN